MASLLMLERDLLTVGRMIFRVGLDLGVGRIEVTMLDVVWKA